jgi:hypothetical protein
MALLEEQFTEKLQAGASPITYEGNEGKEQQVAQAIWDKLPPQARMQFGSFTQFFNSGAWKKVLQALQQQMQGGQEEIQETETETIGRAPQEGLGALMPGPRPMAFGGVAGDDGRRAYGLGSIFKSITKPIKKIVKSPVGKAALLGAGIYGLGGGSFFGRQLPGLATKGLTGGFQMANLKPNVMKYLIGQAGGAPGVKDAWGILGSGGKFSPWRAGAAATLAPFAMSATGNWDADETFDDLKLKAQQFGFDYEQMIRDIQNAENEEDYLAVLAKYNLSTSDLPPWGSQKRAQGGRIGAQEGGLMNLGGMEKDYRNDGGFVPIGEYEKKDDVPARLSKNEFVFTADAVRGAGGGDIDKGAEIMENVMKNLEGGGRISDESQGQGARDMFQVSERLSEVV